MVATILDDQDRSLVINRAGSNLSRGVVSSLIESAKVFGGMKGSHGLFEVDEAAMPAVAQMLQPKAILVLNLFRDQLDRYGELDTTAGLIGGAIGNTEAEVYLNADDPLVASLSKYVQDRKRVHFFGLNDLPSHKLAHDVTADSVTCPVDGKPLVYTQNFFGHVGHYSCPAGHFDRPNPQVVGEHVELNPEGASFKINTGTTRSQVVQLKLPGSYNVYNAVAAFALADGLGVAPDDIAQSLAGVAAAFGRVEQLDIDGKRLYLLLIKNPTGFNQIIQTFLLGPQKQKVLMMINDNFADGRDVSWLWDVAFEELQPQNHRIAASGIRASDLALRLKYADMGVDIIEPDLSDALEHFLGELKQGETGYIVPTYTAMLETRKLLGKRTKLVEEWK
jgi:UDP-N-acetylmuramyl tripeptide synthase